MISRVCALHSCLLVVFSMIIGAPSAGAGMMTSLSVEATPVPGGLTKYEYTLTNLDSSTLPVVQFDLSISSQARLDAIIAPDGWEITYEAGNELIEFTSLSDQSDLLPGSDGRFSFVSPLAPSITDFLIVGIDVTTVTVETNQGQVLGPAASAVPEPCALTLLATGIPTLIIYGWTRRKQVELYAT